jgi:hypothetical protein
MNNLPPPPDLEPFDTYDERLNAWYEVCDAILRAGEVARNTVTPQMLAAE